MLAPDTINQLTKGTPLARKIKRLEAALRSKPSTPTSLRGSVASSLADRVKISERLDPVKTPEQENPKTLTNNKQSTCKNSQGENSPEKPGENAGENSDFHPNPDSSHATNSTIPAKLPADILAALHDALTSPARREGVGHPAQNPECEKACGTDTGSVPRAFRRFSQMGVDLGLGA